jgi:hypothetical protein
MHDFHNSPISIEKSGWDGSGSGVMRLCPQSHLQPVRAVSEGWGLSQLDSFRLRSRWMTPSAAINRDDLVRRGPTARILHHRLQQRRSFRLYRRRIDFRVRLTGRFWLGQRDRSDVRGGIALAASPRSEPIPPCRKHLPNRLQRGDPLASCLKASEMGVWSKEDQQASRL